MVELIFNSGRNRWTEDMIENFSCLAWRYCISCEEQYGANACVINLHNLTYLPDDIQRFSAPDNFWCFEFERAVRRYVQQSSNKKHIEKSFARRESQFDFHVFLIFLKSISMVTDHSYFYFSYFINGLCLSFTRRSSSCH